MLWQEEALEKTFAAARSAGLSSKGKERLVVLSLSPREVCVRGRAWAK